MSYLTCQHINYIKKAEVKLQNPTYTKSKYSDIFSTVAEDWVVMRKQLTPVIKKHEYFRHNELRVLELKFANEELKRVEEKKCENTFFSTLMNYWQDIYDSIMEAKNSTAYKDLKNSNFYQYVIYLVSSVMGSMLIKSDECVAIRKVLISIRDKIMTTQRRDFSASKWPRIAEHEDALHIFRK
jgi:hypothetical protein